MTEYTFQLMGADNALHSYIGTTLPPAAGGVKLALAIYSLAMAPSATLIKELVAAVGGLGELIDLFQHKGPKAIAKLVDELDLDGALKRFDAASFGEAAAQSLSKLPPQLVMELLAHTSRDGSPLRQEANFNAAFRANYIELALAVMHVASENGFFTFGSTSPTSNGATDEAAASDATATPPESLPV